VRILITGANGHIGRRLIARLTPLHDVTALVRSNAAQEKLQGQGADVIVVDYADPSALTAAARGCHCAVHLVGILKESKASRYTDAHEGSTAALVAAARETGLERIVYLSILGADPHANNACLASKGRAEEMLRTSGITALTLRVPMVLGEGDYASRALSRRAHSPLTVLIRGESLEQPIYAGDVVEAIVAGLAPDTRVGAVLDLAGPESLSRAALVNRAAAVRGEGPRRCISLPLAPVLAAAHGIEVLARWFGRDPPVTRAMLEVLDHDDAIEPRTAAERLDISLTGLDEMLRRCLSAPASMRETDHDRPNSPSARQQTGL
jgi:NADH dehydrogenase